MSALRLHIRGVRGLPLPINVQSASVSAVLTIPSFADDVLAVTTAQLPLADQPKATVRAAQATDASPSVGAAIIVECDDLTLQHECKIEGVHPDIILDTLCNSNITGQLLLEYAPATAVNPSSPADAAKKPDKASAGKRATQKTPAVALDLIKAPIGTFSIPLAALCRGAESKEPATIDAWIPIPLDAALAGSSADHSCEVHVVAYFDQAADSNSSAGVTAAVTASKVTLQLNQLMALPQSLWSSAPAEADAAATSSVKCTVSAVIPVGASQSKRHVTKAISLSTPVNAVSIDVSQAFTADPAEWAKRASEGAPLIIQITCQREAPVAASTAAAGSKAKSSSKKRETTQTGALAADMAAAASMVFTAVANIDLTDGLWPGATRVSGTFPVTLQRANTASADASTQVEDPFLKAGTCLDMSIEFSEPLVAIKPLPTVEEMIPKCEIVVPAVPPPTHAEAFRAAVLQVAAVLKDQYAILATQSDALSKTVDGKVFLAWLKETGQMKRIQQQLETGVLATLYAEFTKQDLQGPDASIIAARKQAVTNELYVVLFKEALKTLEAAAAGVTSSAGKHPADDASGKDAQLRGVLWSSRRKLTLAQEAETLNMQLTALHHVESVIAQLEEEDQIHASASPDLRRELHDVLADAWHVYALLLRRQDDGPILGNGSTNANRKARTEACLTEALKSKPDHLDSLVTLGLHLAEQDDMERATELLEHALTICNASSATASAMPVPPRTRLVVIAALGLLRLQDEDDDGMIACLHEAAGIAIQDRTIARSAPAELALVLVEQRLLKLAEYFLLQQFEAEPVTWEQYLHGNQTDTCSPDLQRLLPLFTTGQVTEEVAHLLLCAAELCRVTGHLAPAQSISSAVVDWAIEHGAADAQATSASNMPSVVELLMAYGVQVRSMATSTTDAGAHKPTLILREEEARTIAEAFLSQAQVQAQHPAMLPASASLSGFVQSVQRRRQQLSWELGLAYVEAGQAQRATELFAQLCQNSLPALPVSVRSNPHVLPQVVLHNSGRRPGSPLLSSSGNGVSSPSIAAAPSKLLAREAIRVSTVAAEQHVGSFAWLGLAKALLVEGQLDQAEKALSICLVLDSENLAAVQTLKELYEATSNQDAHVVVGSYETKLRSLVEASAQ